MPLLNYTTKISAHKTVGEVQRILAEHGAQFVTVGYDGDGDPTGVGFVYCVNDVPINFKLGCHWEGVLTVMQADRKVPQSLCYDEQALRVGWRIVKSWVKAQIAYVESGQAKMEQVFLPYAQLKDGSTFFGMIEGGGAQKLLSQPEVAVT